jgi:hypothetical protein
MNSGLTSLRHYNRRVPARLTGQAKRSGKAKAVKKMLYAAYWVTL